MLAKKRPHIIKPLELDECGRLIRQLVWWRPPSHRRQAIIALTPLREVRAVEPLIRCLKSRHHQVRDKAATALAEIGQPAVEFLLEMLLEEDNSWKIGKRAPSRQASGIKAALYRIGAPSIPQCIQALSHLGLHSSIKEILQHFPGEQVEPALIEALEHENESTREAIADILQQRGWSPENEHQRTAFQIALRTIERVIFTKHDSEQIDGPQTLRNPEMRRLHIPIPTLRQIDIDAEHYDFHVIERFLTYVLSTLGQDYLKDSVSVCLYGDEQHVSKHLMNLLTNLCKEVSLSPLQAPQHEFIKAIRPPEKTA